MKNLELHSRVLGPVRTNCYFLFNKTTRELLIVDPADEPEEIFRKIDALQGTPAGILLTHGHFDHISAANALREKYHIAIYACSWEKEMLEDPGFNLSLYQGRPVSVKADRYLEDLEVFEAAGFTLQMLHTPGHTEGSCCYHIAEEGVLMSGDTLFCGSCGRTDLPGGNSTQMRLSLRRLLTSLPDETEVFPGHESFTSIDQEKRYNPFV